MKKIILGLFILSSLAQAFAVAKVEKGCIVHIPGDYEVYLSLKNIHIARMKSANIMEIGMFKVEDENYKEVVKAWKKCQK